MLSLVTGNVLSPRPFRRSWQMFSNTFARQQRRASKHSAEELPFPPLLAELANSWSWRSHFPAFYILTILLMIAIWSDQWTGLCSGQCACFSAKSDNSLHLLSLFTGYIPELIDESIYIPPLACPLPWGIIICTAVVYDCKYNYILLGFSNLLCTSLLHSTCLPTCVYRWLLLLFEVYGVVAKSEQRVNSRGVRNSAIATLILWSRTPRTGDISKLLYDRLCVVLY